MPLAAKFPSCRISCDTGTLHARADAIFGCHGRRKNRAKARSVVRLIFSNQRNPRNIDLAKSEKSGLIECAQSHSFFFGLVAHTTSPAPSIFILTRRRSGGTCITAAIGGRLPILAKPYSMVFRYSRSATALPVHAQGPEIGRNRGAVARPKPHTSCFRANGGRRR